MSDGRKRNIWIDIGAGYGDEGKGLMADYFCNSNTLNVKVNGGAQAGHTVCSLPSKEKAKQKDFSVGLDSELNLEVNMNQGSAPQYKRFVFRQLGSGTFKGASTYLGPKFMVNFSELLLELEMLKTLYNTKPTLYIDDRSLVTLPIYIEMNKLSEGLLHHGSCGLGIYETFHAKELHDKGNKGFSYTVQELLNLYVRGEEAFLNEMDIYSSNYLIYRLKELEHAGRIRIHRPNGDIKQNDNYKSMMNQVHIRNITLHQSITEILKNPDIDVVKDINDVPHIETKDILFECSQGLELDMDQSDNAPHLTPSNTGVKNVTEILNEITDCNWSDVHMELVFILRSYMTKHGNGDFRTLQKTLQENYSLYDRTNIKNSFQGSIRYGLIDTERTQNLILNQRCIFEKEFKYFEEADPDALLAITHLDQTNNKLLTTRGEIPADELDLLFRFDNKAYLSYGETSNTVYECEY